MTGKNGGGIKREQTSSANIVPICYGTISANGSKGSGCTPNFTVTRQSKGVYDIKIKDENFISSSHTCIASLGSLGLIYSSGDSGNIRVNTYSISGKSADKEFSIVVFKP
ncbi:MAG: hypothetical protein IPH57_06675 [Saprospiraceae bacterium]|nr:hypothetical protein [Saprospiraceae bacterium]